MAAPSDLGPQAVVAFDIGLGFTAQDQRLRCIQRRPANHLGIDQTVQKVQHMGLGGHARCQGRFHCGQHSLFIVVQDQRQHIDHLSVATRLAQHMILQLSEGTWQFQERRAIPESAGLALNDSQVVPPIIDRLRWQLVTALDHPQMFAQDVALGCNDQPIRIYPQADRAIGKGRRNALAIALEADQTCGGDAFAVLDKTVKGRRQLHQGCSFFGPDIRNTAG